MEGTYYNNPAFPFAEDPNNQEKTEIVESVENRFSLNDFKDKKVAIYASFNNSMIWRDKKFEGIIKDIKNHYLLLLSNENLYLIVPLNYINFIELK